MFFASLPRSAIVSPIAGTTRDRVSETIQIEGVPIHITDTAGLRDDADASDEVERIGVARSWESIASADAIVFLHDLTRWDDPDYQAADAVIAQRLRVADPARLLQVFNKADSGRPLPPGREGLCLSARTGGSLVILGSIVIVIALFFSQSVAVIFKMFPPSILGVILFLAGAELAVTVRDIGNKRDEFYTMIVVAGFAMWHMGVAFVVGVILDNALCRKWIKI